jgi:hypothetical protein
MLRYIFDGAFNFRARRGAFKLAQDLGMQVFAVVPPPGVISVAGNGQNTNRNDVKDTYLYTNPNEIPPVQTEEEEETEERAKEYDDPCEDLVQIENENLNKNDVIIFGDKDGRSGLMEANGSSYKASVQVGGETAFFEFVLPSLSSHRWKTKTTYEFSFISEGSIDASNQWNKVGPIEADGDVLNHSVIITEIPVTFEGTDTELDLDSSSVSAGPVPVAEYTVNGFYLPTENPALQSLSATLDPSEGLVVSYRYQGERPMPISNIMTISPTIYEINQTIS